MENKVSRFIILYIISYSKIVKELLAKIVLNDSLNLFYIHTYLKEQVILLHCRSPPINTIF